MGILRAGCVALALSVSAVPAHAQSATADDLVQVNIMDHQVVSDLARALRVEVNQIPAMVHVPVRVAARVCGVAAKVLKQDDSDPVNCDAMTISPAFRRAVRLQLIEE